MLQLEKGALMQDASVLYNSVLSFPKNWSGDLPRVSTRDALRSQVTSIIRRRQMTAPEAEEFLNLLERLEKEYFEPPDGRLYHRACGGGAVVWNNLGVHCANCGKLPSLLPPVFA